MSKKKLHVDERRVLQLNQNFVDLLNGLKAPQGERITFRELKDAEQFRSFLVCLKLDLIWLYRERERLESALSEAKSATAILSTKFSLPSSFTDVSGIKTRSSMVEKAFSRGVEVYTGLFHKFVESASPEGIRAYIHGKLSTQIDNTRSFPPAHLDDKFVMEWMEEQKELDLMAGFDSKAGVSIAAKKKIQVEKKKEEENVEEILDALRGKILSRLNEEPDDPNPIIHLKL